MVSWIAPSMRTVGWNAGREVLYLDVGLSVSGGLFQIKGHPEGLHDVIMRIETQRPAVTFVPFGRPDCRGHFTPTRVWIEDREGRGIGCSYSTSRATPIGITSPRRFCSHSLVSTSARLGHMKNTARPGNGCRCSFPRPSRLIVQNRPSFSMRKVFFSDSTTSPRSLAQSERTTVSTTHRSRGWYFRRSAAWSGARRLARSSRVRPPSCC
jgi:hypothetical protein